MALAGRCATRKSSSVTYGYKEIVFGNHTHTLQSKELHLVSSNTTERFAQLRRGCLILHNVDLRIVSSEVRKRYEIGRAHV